jgi:hypothetical protein
VSAAAVMHARTDYGAAQIALRWSTVALIGLQLLADEVVQQGLAIG